MPFTLTMPKLSPTMETGVIVKWLKKPGEHVAAGDAVMEVSTDKATVEHTALDEGFLREILIQEGQTAEVNQPIAIFSEELNEKLEALPKKAAEAPLVKVVEAPSRIAASPLAKKLAKDQGIDLAKVQGSGPRGRIVSKDLEKAEVSASSSTSFSSGAFEEEALTPIRKVIAEKLQAAKATIPHFYVQQAINAEALIDFREQLAKSQVKVSVNDCLIKACALALKSHPHINTGFNAAKQTVIKFKTIDISIAVNAPSGLITPIVFRADTKPLKEIAKEVIALAQKAKDGKLAPHEFQGGSFTISNMGMYGVANFAGIINPPQAALLAVSAISDQPVVKAGAVVPGKLMNVNLSVDHRVIDGAAAAEFLGTLKRLLENPIALLL